MALCEYSIIGFIIAMTSYNNCNMSSCTYSKNSLVTVENKFSMKTIRILGGKFIIDAVSEFCILFYLNEK